MLYFLVFLGIYLFGGIYHPFLLCQFTSLYLVFRRFICCVPSCICVSALIHTKIPQKEHYFFHIRYFLWFSDDFVHFLLFCVLIAFFLLIFCVFDYRHMCFLPQMCAHSFYKCISFCFCYFLCVYFPFCLVIPQVIVYFFLFLHFTRVVILLIVP